MTKKKKIFGTRTSMQLYQNYQNLSQQEGETKASIAINESF